MTIHTDVGFSTGVYVVTRFPPGTWTAGRFVEPTPVTLTADLTEVPGDESTTEQEHGVEATETRTLYTDFPLLAARPSVPIGPEPGVGQKADQVTIDGEQWIVRKVNHYKILSGHYMVTVERLTTGEAT